jgi:glucan 1,3-beta-glucosidase
MVAKRSRDPLFAIQHLEVYLAVISFVIFILYCYFEKPPTSQLVEVSAIVNHNKYFYIKQSSSLVNNYYFVNGSSLHSDSFPRIQSSKFSFTMVGSCFHIAAFNQKWLTIDALGKLAVAEPDEDKLLFEFTNIQSYGANNIASEIKLCGGDLRLLSSLDVPAIIGFEAIIQTRGVNLGGWFIPEVWMNPTFYQGTGVGWGGSLCAVVNESRVNAEELIQVHLQTWIQESDFREISQAGFSSVRIPIGYWNVVKDPYKLYAPANLSLSLMYLDWAMDMADKYNLTVLIDIHGGPGSQNGQDHSGCGYSILGAPRWTEPKNINLTLQAVEAIVRRYHNREALYGIELLNEPAQSIEESNHFTLAAFYQNAYHIIRRHNPRIMVVFNELYQKCYSWWNQVLMEPVYYNVIVDWHLYDCMGGQSLETHEQHLIDAAAFGPLIESFNNVHPIIIGEWSMSTGLDSPDQQFVTDTVSAFKNAAGWYLWTWKTDRSSGYDAWDVQYQLQLKNGLRPLAAS